MTKMNFPLTGLLAIVILTAIFGCTVSTDGDYELREIGRVREYTPDLRQALTLFDELLPASGPRADSLLRALAPAVRPNPSPELAEDFYERRLRWNRAYANPADTLQGLAEAYEALVEAGADSVAAQLGMQLSRTYFLKEDYVEAFRYSQEVEALALKIGDSLALARTLINKSNALRFAGMHEMVRENLDEAISIARRNDYHEVVATALINKGIDVGILGNLDSAFLLEDQGYRYALRHNEEESIGLGLLSLAELKSLKGKHAEGIALLREGLSLSGDARTPKNLMMHLNLGLMHLRRGDNAKAKEELTYALNTSDSIGFAFGYNRALGALSYYHQVQGSYEEALEYAQRYGRAAEKTRGAVIGTKLHILLSRDALAAEAAKVEDLEQRRLQRSRRIRRWLTVGAPLLLVFLVGIGALLSTNNRRKEAEQQRAMAEAKLKALQSRMNPHFIYNTINGVQNYILKSERIEAYSYLSKFSNLLRTVNKSAESLYTPLEEEVELLRNYLELEKLRFRKQLTFVITVEDELLNLDPELPSMMLQPIVENALLHGISELGRPGHISVDFRRHKDGLVCTVEDNGRGRRAAAEIAAQYPERHLSFSTKTGMERISFLNRIGYTDADIVITDLADGDKPIGTRVSVYLPFMTTT